MGGYVLLQGMGRGGIFPSAGGALKGKGGWWWIFPQDHVGRPGQSLESNQFLPNFKGCTSATHSCPKFQRLYFHSAFSTLLSRVNKHQHACLLTFSKAKAFSCELSPISQLEAALSYIEGRSNAIRFVLVLGENGDSHEWGRR